MIDEEEEEERDEEEVEIFLMSSVILNFLFSIFMTLQYVSEREHGGPSGKSLRGRGEISSVVLGVLSL